MKITEEKIKIKYPIKCGMCHKEIADYLISKPDNTNMFFPRCTACKETMLMAFRNQENTAVMRATRPDHPARVAMRNRIVTIVRIEKK